MSVLVDYVGRFERSIERNQRFLENEIQEFEDLCNGAVELGDATVLRQAETSFKRALARFHEIDQAMLVLRGPKYRSFAAGMTQREPILLAIRRRYQEAYGRVKQRRCNEPPPASPEPVPRQDRAMPFESPHRVAALHELIINHHQQADGSVMAVSFIVIQGDPSNLREIPMDGSGLGERDLIERTADGEVRVALYHPAALSSDVIEKVVVKRFFSVAGSEVRAVVYRLSAPEDLHSPFVSTIRHNLPRVSAREVLTLNPPVSPPVAWAVSRSRHTSDAPSPDSRSVVQLTGVRDPEDVMDRGRVRGAWNGDTPLWKAFWLYFVLGLNFGVLIAGYVFGLVGIPSFAVWIVIAPAVVWAAVSVWRCAFNARWRGWGYIARVVLIVQLVGVGAGLVVTRHGETRRAATARVSRLTSDSTGAILGRTTERRLAGRR